MHLYLLRETNMCYNWEEDEYEGFVFPLVYNLHLFFSRIWIDELFKYIVVSQYVYVR